MSKFKGISAGCIAALLVLLVAGCGKSGSSNTDTPISDAPVSEPDILPANSAVLSWSAPMTRQNGSSLAMGELDKYIISYGQSSDPELWTAQVVVPEASSQAEASYQFDGLEAGSWYFAVQVVDNEGRVSVLSNIVSKEIPLEDDSNQS